ncbi:GNAT family N-acetyltransferase [Amycolatopsis sp. EV170708-02-1]|nr:GNAT family N-acetyltransferase [Amycolatopsis sp. EV170708-02-1]UMP00096.1 GNAT family N-acetyltransferase [Amycolatopsis sp. EV170708-02-1]
MATVRKSGRCAEVGILVEDRWQGRRIGTALLDRLVTLARSEDTAAVVAIVQEANTAMIRAMRRASAEADQIGTDLAYLTLQLARSRVLESRSDDAGRRH